MIHDRADVWTAPDGWPLARVRLAPLGRAAERGALLFLAGRADHMEKYAESLHHWARGGWAVESFDWRGQGGSGRLADDPMLGHVGDFECWLDDLAAYCAEWRRRTVGPHVIVAHSMGGHLALRALAEERIGADAAVLIAPMLGIHAGGLPHPLASRIAGAACALGRSHRAMWPHRADGTAKARAMRDHLTHSEERFAREVQVRREHPELAMDAPSWGWLRAAYASIGRLAAAGAVERVTTPLLILAALGDRLVSTAMIARMMRRLPNARLHCYGRGVAHEILREVDSVRDDALARIDDFLAECAPARTRREAAR